MLVNVWGVFKAWTSGKWVKGCVGLSWHYLENVGENVAWTYDCDEAADLILHVQDPLK